MKKLMCILFTLIMVISAIPFSAFTRTHASKVTTMSTIVTESEIAPQIVPRRQRPVRANRHRQPATKHFHRATKSNHALTLGGVWSRLRKCESGGLYSANTGNGFFGAYQFTLSSWKAVGGTGYPQNATPAEQDRRAKRLKELQGWGAWPACTRKLGIR